MKPITFLKGLRLLALPLLLTATSAWGQTSYTWTVRINAADPMASPKPLFSAVVDAIPTAEVEHDRATQLLRIHTMQVVQQQWMEEVAADAGFQVTGFWRDGEDLYVRKVGAHESEGLAPVQPNEQHSESNVE